MAVQNLCAYNAVNGEVYNNHEVDTVMITTEAGVGAYELRYVKRIVVSIPKFGERIVVDSMVLSVLWEC